MSVSALGVQHHARLRAIAEDSKYSQSYDISLQEVILGGLDPGAHYTQFEANQAGELESLLDVDGGRVVDVRLLGSAVADLGQQGQHRRHHANNGG